MKFVYLEEMFAER